VLKSVGIEISKMSKPMTRQASASRVGAESGTDDTSRVLDDTSSAEMLISLMHSVNQLIRRLDENREEFRAFKKTYDMDREVRDTTKDTTLRDDILSIAQAVRNLTHEVRNLQNNGVTVKHDDPQVPSEIDQNHSPNQIESAIRPKSPSLENAAPASRQRREPTLRDILTPVPEFDGYNIPLSQFIRECREVETAVSPDEEANVLLLLRGKLRGRARQALQGRHFASIKQLIYRLQTSFGVSRNSFVWYAELEKLSQGRRESIAAYIERAQDLYDNIIEAERYEKQSLAQSDIIRISGRFIDKFYCGLPNNIQILVDRRDARTPVEMYVMVERANQMIETNHNSQNQTYAGASRTSRYEPNTRNARENSHNTPENDRVSNLDDRGQGNSRERTDGNTPPRHRPGSRASEPRNERSSKWCRYCKISGHEIEECRKRAYNNSRNNHSGNAQNPSRPADRPRAGPNNTRPVNMIVSRETEPEVEEEEDEGSRQ